jgi:hypothetical protein
VAPSRGGSLARFVEKARCFRLALGSGGVIQFGVEVVEDFDEHVTLQCAENCSGIDGFEDRHKPLLVVLSVTTRVSREE